jgi:hypothetical protein
MNRQTPVEQPSEGYWTTSPLFGQPAATDEEDSYTIPSASAAGLAQQHQHQHQHQHQRYSPWFLQPTVPQAQWITEPSDPIYPPDSLSRSSGGRSELSQRASAASPLGSPNLTSSEQDEYGRFVCKYPECDSKPEDRIFTRKSDWRCASLPSFILSAHLLIRDKPSL